ncbi:pentapeptide repeat-containing protein [Rhizobium ruizarguesonis]|uniref:pentapeptide repeat-containing protein n=1 Tax=Rhizobium ruizarguesonis TaxID=2081791 RepID=UPI001639F024|nr:pentapeptide repeat-containing protein [Rhizobium ruizarguesonis]MBC2807034.1 pentapeptide repeat-containing protein [Rhizobium ruizarguesonis]
MVHDEGIPSTDLNVGPAGRIDLDGQEGVQGSNAEPPKGRIKRILGWGYRNHAVLNSAAAGLSAFAALVGITIAVITAVSQHQTNILVQKQLSQQSDASEGQLDQFKATRETDLAKIVLDPSVSASLKSYALKELLHVRRRAFGKTGVESNEAEIHWREAAQIADLAQRKKSLIEMARWECEQYSDTGGGTGTTKRRMLDLRNADLKNVDLSDEHIECVDMSGADLRGALLNSADFGNVILNEVSLDGAEIENTTFYWSVLDVADPLPQRKALIARINKLFGQHWAVTCSEKRHTELKIGPVGIQGVCE